MSTLKVLTTPKSVTIWSDPMDDIPAPIQNPTPLETPVLVQGGAWLKTHRVDGTPLLPPISPPSPQPQSLVLRRILSSTPLEENGEDVDRRGRLIMRKRGKY